MYKKKQHLLTILLSIGLSICMTASSVVYASDTRTVPAEVPALEGEVEEEAASIPEETDKEEAVSQIQGPEENIGLDSETRAATISIADADALIDFANKINNGVYSADINAVLVGDINMAGKIWKPIGRNSNGRRYAGTFDGNHCRIFNVSCTVSGDDAGIFGATEGALIRNLGVTGSFSGLEYVGGIVGYARATTTIENCWNGARINASKGHAGGVAGSVGEWGDSVIKNCYNYGKITGTYNVGGIVGTLGDVATVLNSISYAEPERRIAGEIPWGGPGVKNSYYLSKSQEVGTRGTAATEAQFASGEIAWLLNGKSASGIWKQNVGTDAYPTFKGATVEPAPAPDFTYSSTSNSITVMGGLEEDIYGTALYKIDNQQWTNNPAFEDLKANSSYLIRVKYLGKGNYLPSEEAQKPVSTLPASYTITIPMQATAGGSSENIQVNQAEPFELGHNGQVNVKVTDGITDGKLHLTRQQDSVTIQSQMLVYWNEFKNPSQIVASFKDKRDTPVIISFTSPKPDDGEVIPAGSYSGTVTFEIEYTQ